MDFDGKMGQKGMQRYQMRPDESAGLPACSFHPYPQLWAVLLPHTGGVAWSHQHKATVNVPNGCTGKKAVAEA